LGGEGHGREGTGCRRIEEEARLVRHQLGWGVYREGRAGGLHHGPERYVIRELWGW
jgi:hypothetical protein